MLHEGHDSRSLCGPSLRRIAPGSGLSSPQGGYDDRGTKSTDFQADLYEGETVLFRWKNAVMTHDPPATAEAFEVLAEENPRFLAAWLKTVFPNGDATRPVRISNLRGRNGWDTVSKYMQDPGLDLSHATVDSGLAKAFFELAASKGKASIADCLCYLPQQGTSHGDP